MRTRNHGNRRPQEAEELNLIPVMNLFVCLIPFLLMSAAFVQLGAVDAETPSRGAPASEESAEVKQEIRLIVQVDSKHIRLSAFSDAYQTRLPDYDQMIAMDDRSALQERLKEIAEATQVHSTLFRVESETAYSSAIGVLQEIRQTENIGKVVLATEVVRQ